MMRQLRYSLDRAWRTLATGICFAFFFTGGLVESLTIFPILHLWPGTLRQKRARVRVAIQYTFRLFVGMMEALGLIKVRLHNAELMQRRGGCIVIANHPTLIDVVILMSVVPNANGVVKGELWHNFYLRRVVSAAGFISNADAEAMLQGCSEALANEDAIIIFPEGSRSVPGAPLQFKRGVANIAVRTDASLLAVFITCNPITLVKGEPWYRIPSRRADIDMHFHEWLDPRQLAPSYDDKPAAARQLTRNLQDYYAKGLKAYD